MARINKCAIAVMILFFIFGCTACEFNEEAINDKTQSEKDKIIVDSDNVEKTNISTEHIVYRGEMRKVKDLSKPQLCFPINSKYEKDEDIVDAEVWEDKEGNYLLIESGSIYYTSKKFYSTYEYLLYDEVGEFRNNYDEIIKTENIQGLSEEEAVTKVKEVVDGFNLEVKNTKAYPLTRDNLVKLSRMYMSDEEYEKYMEDSENEPLKRDFTIEDEAYLIVFDLSVQGNVLFSKEYNYGEQCYLGSVVWAIVSRDGLETFRASGIYDVDKNYSREIEAISLEQAKEEMNKKFDNILSGNKVECKNVKQLYIPVSDGKNKGVFFVPVYVFEIEEEISLSKGDENSTMKQKGILLLDMENGKWIE